MGRRWDVSCVVETKNGVLAGLSLDETECPEKEADARVYINTARWTGFWGKREQPSRRGG